MTLKRWMYLNRNLVIVTCKKVAILPREKNDTRDLSTADGVTSASSYVSEYEKHLYPENHIPTKYKNTDDVHVDVEGGKIETMSSFKDIDFGPVINANVKRCSYDIPTIIQKYAIPALLNNTDIIGCSQTGSGKTAAYLLPALYNINQSYIKSSETRSNHTEPMALILAPTRELAQQIEHEARRLIYQTKIKVVSIFGGTSYNGQMNKISMGCDLLIATPGRLIDVLSNRGINLSHCKYFVMDEADRMLDMGFMPQIERILGLSKIPGKSDRQTVMFSATFPKNVQHLADLFISNPIKITVGSMQFTCDHIKQDFIQLRPNLKDSKLLELVSSIKSEDSSARILVFTERKREVDDIEILLYNAGHKVVSIHSDRSQAERDSALSLFRRKEASIMVATDVAQRGLDISQVTHVINLSFPRSIEDYVHRIGRTGRCGNIGKAISFIDINDGPLIGALIKLLTENKQSVPDFLHKLKRDVTMHRQSYTQRNRENSHSSERLMDPGYFPRDKY